MKTNNVLKHGQATISTTAALAVEAELVGSRKEVTLLNTDSTNTIYIGNVGLTTATGFPLIPGASQTLPFSGNIWAIASAGTPKLAWIATENLG